MSDYGSLGEPDVMITDMSKTPTVDRSLRKTEALLLVADAKEQIDRILADLTAKLRHEL